MIGRQRVRQEWQYVQLEDRELAGFLAYLSRSRYPPLRA